MENQKDTYRTLEAPCEGLFKDKGSKFLAYAYPIDSEDEVKPLVQALKKEHYSARHHCYAWRLGADGEHYRANDDGEPSGTAGRPILGQLLSANVTQCLVVVVRYFGGTLLGVSGLINAYKKATAEALLNAVIVEKIIEKKLRLTFEYPLQNSVMKVVKDLQLEVGHAKYEMDCTIEVPVRLSQLEKAEALFNDIDGVSIEIL